MKIICIGRNYKDHALELSNPIPKEPLFFLKPDSSLLIKNAPLFYPDFSNDIHYELELVIRINRIGKNIQEKFAHKYYSEIGLGLDFTARDLQNALKEKGMPWEKAKAFDGSAAISPMFSIQQYQQDNISFFLNKNGQKVQEGQSKDMLFSIHKIIAHISQFMTLKIGDYIFTGTPKGVGPVQKNDLLEAYLEGEKILECRVK